MSYKTELQANNADIRALIEQAKALPDAEADEPVLQSKTVTPATSKQTVSPDSGYDGLSSVTVEAMPTATQATPSITVSTSGLITAKSTQSAGYVASGTKQATEQLTTQAAKTVTPSTAEQTAVGSGVYTTGAVKVAPIPAKYVDNSTADAAEADVMAGKKFGKQSGIGTGTFTLDNELSTQESLIDQIQTALQGKASGGSGGASLETCEVSFTSGGGSNAPQTFLVVEENGAPQMKTIFHYEIQGSTSPVVCNAVVGATIVVMDTGYEGLSFRVSDNVTIVSVGDEPNLGMAVGRLVITGGTTASIVISD